MYYLIAAGTFFQERKRIISGRMLYLLFASYSVTPGRRFSSRTIPAQSSNRSFMVSVLPLALGSRSHAFSASDACQIAWLPSKTQQAPIFVGAVEKT